VGVPCPPRLHTIPMPCLTESNGILLMTRRNISTSNVTTYRFGRSGCILVPGRSEFEVYKANFGRFSWAEVRSLATNQALFIGRGCSRSVCVSPYSLSQDCIFLLDDYTDWLWEKTTTSCNGHERQKHLFTFAYGILEECRRPSNLALVSRYVC
jgi:hypothetical protein